jgi:arylsulfatase A-like enzyme
MNSEGKPNIIFLVIDSLRADRIFNNIKTTKIPTIDKLRKEGVYFSQTISTSDVTGTGIGCFFSGVYPFESGITETKVDSTLFTLINILKKNGYKMYGSGPNFKFFQNLSNFLDNSFYYDYQQWREKDTILGKSGKDVINHLKSIQDEPWFYYLHLMDLHGMGKLIKIPPEFDKKEFGETRYDRMVSCIDFWLNDLLKQIDLDNTIIVITADHGEYVSSKINDLTEMPNIYKILRKMKKINPFSEQFSEKAFRKLLKINGDTKKWILSKQLDSKEMRDLLTRSDTDELFDDVIRIPLVISGNKINSSKVINNLIRQVDVLPTIMDLLEINYSDKITGRSLVPILNGGDLEEIPVYIETGTAQHGTSGNTIGIRTSKYKYLRNRFDEKNNIRLFDLINDPSELKNISKKEPGLVKELEETLKKTIKNQTDFEKEELSEEDKMVREELKKLGYLQEN